LLALDALPGCKSDLVDWSSPTYNLHPAEKNIRTKAAQRANQFYISEWIFPFFIQSFKINQAHKWKLGWDL
jgi:hypothetical protein